MRLFGRIVCGLDLTGSAVRLALVEHRRGRTAVRALVSEPLHAGRPIAEQLGNVFRIHHLVWDQLHVSLPGEHATHRLLTFPFADAERLDLAVPGALRALLPVTDDGIFAHEVAHRDEGGTTVCAAFTRRSTLTALLHELAEADLQPSCVRLGPLAAVALVGSSFTSENDVAFLDLAPRVPTLALFHRGRLCLLRVLASEPASDKNTSTAAHVDTIAEEIRWSLATMGIGTSPTLVVAGASVHASIDPMARLRSILGTAVRPFSDVPIPGVQPGWHYLQDEFAVALGLALGAPDGTQTTSGFRNDEDAKRFAKQRGVQTEIRRTRVLAAAVLVLLVVCTGTRYAATRRHLAKTEHALATRVADLAVRNPTIRDVGELQAHVITLTQQIDRLRGRCPDAIEILREVSARIAPTADVAIEELTFESPNAWLTGHARDHRSVDAVGRRLAASPFFGQVETTYAADKGTRVVFKLALELRSDSAGAPLDPRCWRPDA